MTNRIRVEMLGNVYYINTEEPEEHMNEVVAKLSDAIKTLQDAGKGLSVADTLVLLSLNLMNEITQAEDAADHMREQLSDYLEEASEAKVQLEDERKENDKLKKMLADMRSRQSGEETLKTENESLKKEIAEVRSNNADASNEIDRLETRCTELEKMIYELKDENDTLKKDIENLLS